MAGNASVRINELLKCSICLQRYSNPRTLPCQHSFCGQCLASLMKDLFIKHGEFCSFPFHYPPCRCPICKCEHANIETVSSCQPPLFLTQVLDATECDFPAEEKEACFVDGCDEMAANLKCVQCETKVCKKCFGDEDKLQACKSADHLFVEKKERGLSACLKHGISIDLYCTVCKLFICLDCFLTEHRYHETKTIQAIKLEAESLSTKCKNMIEVNNQILQEDGIVIDDVIRNAESKLQIELKTLNNFQVNAFKYLCLVFDGKRKRCISMFESRKKKWREIGENKHEEFMEASEIVNSSDEEDLKAAAQIDVMKKFVESFENHNRMIKSAIRKQDTFGEARLVMGLQEEIDLQKVYYSSADVDKAYKGDPVKSNKIKQFVRSMAVKQIHKDGYNTRGKKKRLTSEYLTDCNAPAKKLKLAYLFV
eukprot:gene15229-16804_t